MIGALAKGLAIGCAVQLALPLPAFSQEWAPPVHGPVSADALPRAVSSPPSPFDRAFGSEWIEALCVPLSADGAADDPLECPPQEPPRPVRPPGPDMLGYVAVAIGTKSQAQAKWEVARAGSLEGMRGPWQELLRGMASGPITETRIAAVNRWVNRRVAFVQDRGGDHWAGAPQTLSRGWGDCEDIALAKLALLQSLGLSPEDMYLVLLRHRQGGDDHAVLAVRHEGHLLLLDNRTDAMSGAGTLRQYAPTISFSGEFMWTYGFASAAIDPQPAAP